MVSDLKTFTNERCKIATQKKFVFWQILPYWAWFFGIGVSHSVNVFFAPTSQIPMSKLFRFSEILGESNGKKWSQIWKLFAHKGYKTAAQIFFIFFFSSNFALLAGFFGFGARLTLNKFRPQYTVFLTFWPHVPYL